MIKYAKTKDIAQMIGCSEWQVRKFTREGKISGFKFGTEWRYDPEKVQRQLERNHAARTPSL